MRVRPLLPLPALLVVVLLSSSGLAALPLGVTDAEVQDPVLTLKCSAEGRLATLPDVDVFEPEPTLNAIQDWMMDDADFDCLTRAEEELAGSSDKSPDTDRDRLLDNVEVGNGFDPTWWDTDNDGIPDYIEYYRGGGSLAPNTDDDNDGLDRDGDGIVDEPLTNLLEYRHGRPADWNEENMGPWLYGTPPLIADADDDGVNDGEEIYRGSNPHAPDVDETTNPSDGDLSGANPPVFTVDLLADYDYDGLDWEGEWMLGADPFNPDSDGDGFCDSGGNTACLDMDGAESSIEGNPASNDSDGDGLPDGVEVAMWNGLLPDLDGDLRGPVADDDSDGDYAADGLEVSLGTSVMQADSDLDGVKDGMEAWFGSYPTFADSDNDGLKDGEELFKLHTDVVGLDSDSDGLGDGAEVQFGTNPRDADTDLDGLPDGWEIDHETQALVADELRDYDGDGLLNTEEFQYGVLPLVLDTSMDGMPDGWEAYNLLDPTVAKPATSDLDADGLPDLKEYLFGTEPGLTDSDGDFLNDAQEVLSYGTDPHLFDTDGDGLWDGAELAYWNTISATAWSTAYVPKPNVPTSCAQPLPINRDDLYYQTIGADDSPQVTSPPPTVVDPCKPLPLCLGPSNLHCPDSDGDGLNDRDEFVVTLTSPADAWSNNDPVPLPSPLSPTEVTDLLWALLHNNGLLYATATDSDGDGLANAVETTNLGSDPARPDSDCDGLGDLFERGYFEGDELSYTFNPTNNQWSAAWAAGPTYSGASAPWNTKDFDQDEVGDGVEVSLFLREPTFPYYTRADDVDTDNDGVLDSDEDADWQDTRQCPLEGIVIPDPCADVEACPDLCEDFEVCPGAEALDWGGGWVSTCPPGVSTVPSPVPPGVLQLGSNPILPDTDGDGLSDPCEVVAGTFAWDCDTDKDRLGDGLEVGVGRHVTVVGLSDTCLGWDHDPTTWTSPLCGSWGILDEVGLPLGFCYDSDDDGLLDGPDMQGLEGEDIYASGRSGQGDGRVVARESRPTTANSDGDAISDFDEALFFESLACNLMTDCDLDGLQDDLDPASTVVIAPEGKGETPLWAIDTDQDSKKNARDPDSDHDGCEAFQPSCYGALSFQDGDEVSYNVDLAVDADDVINVLDSDSDDDYLPDGLEFLMNTLFSLGVPMDMVTPSSDGDLVPDGLDLAPDEALEVLGFDLDRLVIEKVDSGLNGRAGEIYADVILAWDEEGAEVIQRLNPQEITGPPFAGVPPFDTHVGTGDDGIKSDLYSPTGTVGTVSAAGFSDFSHEIDLARMGGTAVQAQNGEFELAVWILIDLYDWDGGSYDMAGVTSDTDNDDTIDVSSKKGERTLKIRLDLVADPVGSVKSLHDARGKVETCGPFYVNAVKSDADCNLESGYHEDDANLSGNVVEIVKGPVLQTVLRYSCFWKDNQAPIPQECMGSPHT